MRRLGIVTLGLLVCFGLVACDGSTSLLEKKKQMEIVYDTDEPDNIGYEGDKEYTDELRMIYYCQQGPFMEYSKKTIKGEAAHRLLTMIEGLEPTGETAEKLSDAQIDWDKNITPDDVYDYQVWIETEDALYRTDFGSDEFAKVEEPLGAGALYVKTDELDEELGDLWFHYPDDCWWGTCENGVLTMSHTYDAPTDESVVVKKLWFGEKKNAIVLDVTSECDQTIRVRWEAAASSDNLATIERREIDLKAGETKSMTLEFDYMVNFVTSPYHYYLEIQVGGVEITIQLEVSEDILELQD